MLQVRRGHANAQKVGASAKASKTVADRPRRQAGPVKYNDAVESDEDSISSDAEDGETGSDGEQPTDADNGKNGRVKAAEVDDDSSDENMRPLATVRRAPRGVCSHSVWIFRTTIPMRVASCSTTQLPPLLSTV